MTEKLIMRYTTLLLLFIALFACDPPEEDNSAYVIEKVAERVAEFMSKFEVECKESVLVVARQRADSLLIDRARRLRLLAGRPPRPSRPGEPQALQLSNPLPLRPLFPFEIRFDTLLRDSLFQDSLRLDSLQQLGPDTLETFSGNGDF
jgi:hypothetical protein